MLRNSQATINADFIASTFIIGPPRTTTKRAENNSFT